MKIYTVLLGRGYSSESSVQVFKTRQEAEKQYIEMTKDIINNIDHEFTGACNSNDQTCDEFFEDMVKCTETEFKAKLEAFEEVSWDDYEVFNTVRLEEHEL